MANIPVIDWEELRDQTGKTHRSIILELVMILIELKEALAATHVVHEAPASCACKGRQSESDEAVAEEHDED